MTQADLLQVAIAAAPFVLVALSSAVDMAFPQPAPGTWQCVLRGFITILALNFNHAKNEQAPK